MTVAPPSPAAAAAYHPISNLGDGFAARIAGEGPGVLWLHPYGLDSSCWGELWTHLPGWRHVGVDLPGHGASMPLQREHDLKQHGQRLLKVAREQRTRHVVGLSLGAMFALQMGIEDEGELGSITLASPLLADGSADDALGSRYRELMTMMQMGGWGDHLRGRLLEVEPSLFASARKRARLFERLSALAAQHPFWDLADGGYQRLMSANHGIVETHSVGCPVLLVVGGADHRAAKKSAETLAGALPRAKRADVVGVGPLSLLEAPERAAGEIRSHLQAAAGADEEKR